MTDLVTLCYCPYLILQQNLTYQLQVKLFDDIDRQFDDIPCIIAQVDVVEPRCHAAGTGDHVGSGDVRGQPGDSSVPVSVRHLQLRTGKVCSQSETSTISGSDGKPFFKRLLLILPLTHTVTYY